MKKIIITFLTIITLAACVREIDDLNFTTFKPGVSFPLGRISMSANSLTKIGDSIQVRQGNDNVIELFYKKNVLNSHLNDRFTINDQLFNDEISFNPFVFDNGETSQAKSSEFNSFTVSNTDLTDPAAELTYILLKEGEITVGQSKDFSHEVETTVTFPKLTKDGQPLTMTINNNEVVKEDLNGYELDLTGLNGDQVNTIDYKFYAGIIKSGNSTKGTINFEFNMSSLKFRYMEGDFFTYAFDEVNEEFDLNLPENEIPENVRFTNPRVEMVVENSAGIDFDLDIKEVAVIEDNGDTLKVTGSYKAETAFVERAKQVEETRTTYYTIDNSNTDNLVELISEIPQTAFFKGLVTANPNGTPPEGNFISDRSKVTVNAEIILPLEGYANNYAINDTINNIDLEFDDDGVISLDNINLRFQTENSFPFDVKLQLYFLDATEQKKVIDSLFLEQDDQLVISSGMVNSSGVVTSSTTKKTDVTLTQEKYEIIRSAKYIRIKASILTSGADQNPRKTVKFTTDNALSISLGVSGNAIVDLNKTDNN